MNASLETIYPTPGHSFCIQSFLDRRLHFNWHYHHELELVVIADGHGHAHIGDTVASFLSPVAFLIGSALPHGFVSDVAIRGWILQFDMQVFKPHGGILELENIAAVLSEANRGLIVNGPQASQIINLLSALDVSTGLDTWIGMLKILDTLSRDPERKNCLQIHRDTSPENSCIDGVISEIFNNISKNFGLAEVSRRAGLTVPTFCRHFKRRFGLSFTEYLLSIRINNAKKLLIQTKLYIDDICYESGFNNISFFNRKFKELTGITPREYRRLFESR